MEPSDTETHVPGQPPAPRAADALAGWDKASAHVPQPRGSTLQRGWRRLLDVALVLWVLRVPLISVGLGLLLMLGVTQAQDTLVDIAMSGAPLAKPAWFCGDIFWLATAAFFLWAMPVHYAGRLLLETDTGLARVRRERDRAAAGGCDLFTYGLLRWAPRVLGAVTFVALACGALAAIANLPTLEDVQVAVAARQQLQLIAVVMLVCVPIFIGYTVARSRLVRAGPLAAFDAALGRLLAGAFRWFRVAPRAGDPNGDLFATGRLILVLYGLLVIAVLIADPLRLAQGMRLALAVPLILGGWVPLGAYLSSLGRRWHAPLLSGLAAASVLGAFLFDHHTVRAAREADQDVVQQATQGKAADSAAAPANVEAKAGPRPTLDVALKQWMTANGCDGAPANCPRPILVAAAGGASRAGFFTASVIGHFMDRQRHLDAHTFTRANGIRLTIEAGDNGRFPPRLLQALEARRQQGGDFGPSDFGPSDFGPSDFGPSDLKPGGKSGDDFATRVFAISGVSGGSYGAVVTAAALEAAPHREPPCGVRPPRFWFSDDRVRTWQDCLEALTSGDYLTPAFFGLAFHDQVQLPRVDRATLLEQAWAQRFCTVIDGSCPETPSRAGGRLSRQFLPPAAEPAAAAGPGPAAGAPAQPPPLWIPLLVLNGTSVETGQRIITTNLAPLYTPSRSGCPTRHEAAAGECPVFTQAIDFHTMLGGNRDISMAQAATNSARFPIISPPGTVRNPTGNTLDRIVDGGYFENYGVQSALELAKAIVTLEPQLAPFILVISNDPASTYNEELNGDGAQMPDGHDHVWLPEATGPIGAIGAVRSGRGRLALAEADQWLHATFGATCPTGLAHIKVWPEARESGRCPLPRKDQSSSLGPNPTPPEIREVSMSWWLSKPVQMNLREQLRINEAGCSNDAAVKAVWTAMITRSGQCTVSAGNLTPAAAGTRP